MTKKRETVFEHPSNHEMLYTRIYDAPRELVWKAWSEPERLAKWFGPNGFSITTHEMQFKEGGFWKFTMHGPDGRNYKNKIHYLEIKAPERIVNKHAGEGSDDVVNFQTIITFEAISKNETKVSMRQIFNSPEDLKFVIDNYHADKGALENIQRLADYIASQTNN